MKCLPGLDYHVHLRTKRSLGVQTWPWARFYAFLCVKIVSKMASGGPLGTSGDFWGASGGLLEASRGPLGVSWASLGVQNRPTFTKNILLFAFLHLSRSRGSIFSWQNAYFRSNMCFSRDEMPPRLWDPCKFTHRIALHRPKIIFSRERMHFVHSFYA